MVPETRDQLNEMKDAHVPAANQVVVLSRTVRSNQRNVLIPMSQP